MHDNEQLQALIDKLTTPVDDGASVDLAGFWADLPDEQLAAMDDAAVAAFDAIRSQENGLTAEDADRLETIANTADAIRAESTRRAEAAAELAQRVDALSQRVARPSTGDPDAPEDAAGTETPDEDGGTDTADGGAGGDTAATGDGTDPVTEVAEPERAGELVTAATTTGPAVPVRRPVRVNLAELRARQPATVGRPPAPDRGQQAITVVAAAEVPGFASGQELASAAELGQALSARISTMPIGVAGTQRAGVAVFKRNLPAALVASDKNSLFDAVEYAADETRLPGGSLIAAIGRRQQERDALTATIITPVIPQDGWCSPSETDYTLCPPLESNFGMVDLPTITITRGGLRYPKMLQWYDLYAGTKYADPAGTLTGITTYDPPDSTDPTTGTGAQIIPHDKITGPAARTTKKCVTIPCPEWAEVRLDAAPFCVETDIPMQTAWPEVVTQFVQRALLARLHRINEYLLAQIAAYANDAATGWQAVVDAAKSPYGVTHSLFDGIRLYAGWYRDLNKMPDGATLEMIAPLWLRDVMKADIAKRFGVGTDVVTDQVIMSHFADLGMRVQFVRGWQNLAQYMKDATSGKWSWQIPNGWPATAQVLMYPAGTFVRGTADIIRLDAIYDSTNIVQNKYIQTFFEDGLALIPRCYKPLSLTVPVCVNGASGGQVDPAKCGLAAS